MNARTELPDAVFAPVRPTPLAASGWTPNVREKTATHESGLLVHFALLPQPEGSALLRDLTAIDRCWVPGGYPVWAVMADLQEVNAALDALGVLNTDDEIPSLIALARGASRTWIQAVLAGEMLAARREIETEPQDEQALRLQGQW